MPFFNILQAMVDGVNGSVAATIMGIDGLPIEKYTSGEKFGRSIVDCDIETVGIEYGKVIEEIKNASGILGFGGVDEITVATAGNCLLVRMITPQYFIAFALTQGANLGKARYLMKKAAVEAKEELEA